VYTALERHQWAADVATAFDHNCDTFPRRNTHWFRDWWRPLRTDTGGGPRVMVRFFRLLADHFPRSADTRYTRELTWGEYLHFTSGAAGADVTDLARGVRAETHPCSWSRGELADEHGPGMMVGRMSPTVYLRITKLFVAASVSS
jgi:hypothetical protein